MNFADIIILAILAVTAFFCVRSIRKNFSSGGGCIGCPDGESCRRRQDARSGCSCGGELKPGDIHIKRRKA